MTGRISRKCRYALRALFELTLRDDPDPVSTQQIAEAQGIPPRFLEIILAELRRGGLVESRRGNVGGYSLAVPASRLTVARVLRFFEPDAFQPSVTRLNAAGRTGDYAFAGLWNSAQTAVEQVLDGTTFADLVEQELAHGRRYVPDYAI